MSYHITGLDRLRGSGLQQKAASPAQLTADVNNYNPSANSFWRLSSDAARNITGIDAGVDGRMIFIANVGAQNIVLVNQSGSSDAENRIITGTGGNVTLAADDTSILLYDATTLRWRLFV